MDGQRRVAAHDGLARHPAGDRVAGRLATAPVGIGTARRKMNCNQIIQFSQQIRTFTKSLSEHPLKSSFVKFSARTNPSGELAPLTASYPPAPLRGRDRTGQTIGHFVRYGAR